MWFEKKIKPQYKGNTHLVRYADDFCVFFNEKEDLESFRALLTARLNQFGLVIAEDKTHITDLTPRTNVGGDRRRITFLGFNVILTKTKSGNGWKVIFKTDGKRFGRAKQAMKEKLENIQHWEIPKQAKRINAILVGHFNYYGLAGNIESLNKFRFETCRLWRRVLSRRSQRGLINWDQMNLLLNQNILVQPRLKLPYRQMNDFVRL